MGCQETARAALVLRSSGVASAEEGTPWMLLVITWALRLRTTVASLSDRLSQTLSKETNFECPICLGKRVYPAQPSQPEKAYFW